MSEFTELRLRLLMGRRILPPGVLRITTPHASPMEFLVVLEEDQETGGIVAVDWFLRRHGFAVVRQSGQPRTLVAKP